MKDGNYPHRDHRRRVREAFRRTAGTDVPDRALLELLLFYSIPRRDTNALAGALLEKYGSLKGVAEAGFDELISFDGMGESSALLLSLLPEIGRRTEGRKSAAADALTGAAIAEKIFNELKDRPSEVFYAACLDALGRMTAGKIISEGSEYGVTADKRAILEFAFEEDADSMVIAHNHPHGEAAPSAEDAELTAEIARLLAETDIRLADHIIVNGGGYLSLASTEKFAHLFR